MAFLAFKTSPCVTAVGDASVSLREVSENAVVGEVSTVVVTSVTVVTPVVRSVVSVDSVIVVVCVGVTSSALTTGGKAATLFDHKVFLMASR